MKALRVVAIFVVMGLLIGGAFGFARYRESLAAAPPARPGSSAAETAADPMVGEAEREGLQNARLLVNRMGVRVVCGQANGRPAVYAGGHLYSAADREPEDFINTWEHWCSPAATDPVTPAAAAGDKADYAASSTSRSLAGSWSASSASSSRSSRSASAG